MAVGGEAAVGDGLHQVGADLFAFTADDDIDPGDFGENLFVHERRVDSAEDADGLWGDALGDFENVFSLVDGGGDRGDVDHIWSDCLHFLARSASETSSVMASMK